MDGSIDKKAESTPWKKTLGLFSSDVKKGGSLKASTTLFFSRWKNNLFSYVDQVISFMKTINIYYFLPTIGFASFFSSTMAILKNSFSSRFQKLMNVFMTFGTSIFYVAASFKNMVNALIVKLNTQILSMLHFIMEAILENYFLMFLSVILNMTFIVAAITKVIFENYY